MPLSITNVTDEMEENSLPSVYLQKAQTTIQWRRL